MSFQDNNSGEAGKEDHASDEMLKKSSKEVATSLQGRLDRLTPLSATCCIYRVPQKLRKVNMEAYTPRVVSIGPLHHGEEHLIAMEEHKLRYLQNFLHRTRKTLEECVEIISREEKTARDCYMEPINMSSKEFVEMILVDGCFIIEVILGFQNWNGRTGKPDDRIFNKPWLIYDVRRDMTLLENQLPLFLLLTLYSQLEVPRHQNHYDSFLLLSVNFFKFYSQMPEAKSCEEIIKTIAKKVSSTREEIKHFVDLLIVCQQPSSTRPQNRSDFKFMIPSATQLHEAGVRFELGSKEERLLDIVYRRSDGVLKIPRLKLDDKCEPLFRNLIAFEQCHYRERLYITDYITLMDQLINTTKDVDVLVNKGIIENLLGDNVAVTNLFNNLLINATTGTDFYLADVTEGLSEYCDVPWNRWKAALRHDYFCSPWRGASTIAAVILLLLTLIQTIFSGKPVK
ncbi:UPF0481 protein At3g47200 isoform X5 [Vitis vinifera]|uniref:UPF0481 protein At3g47200 isoform X5 n=1 Tax=Vitis vinifera TaxID=29760 RepID=UPI0028832114|nr:UPF0481 protein At3g47200 isoform X5 [Vitis vinifera]